MISLVVGTVNRTAELDRLLSSLDQQTYKGFEVLVVDQNLDDRVSIVLRKHKGLQISHLRSPRGLSKARNVGLAAASGTICAVPDDDCWYPPGLLESVNSWFMEHCEFGVLVTSRRDECGELQGPPRRSRHACECGRQNIWYDLTSWNAFWRRSVADDIGGFDERIGVGAETKFQAAEEMDYFLHAIDFGHRIWFEPSMSVIHPSIRERVFSQTYPYALGTGYVLRKHKYSIYLIAKDFVARSLFGSVVSLFSADIPTTQMRLLRALGVVKGYLSARRYV